MAFSGNRKMFSPAISVSICMPLYLAKKTMKVESTSVERDLSAFTKINHKGLGTLVLIKGDSNHIRITSKEDILDLISAEVKGEVLEITANDPVELGFRTFLKLRSPDYRIEVRFTDLEEVVQRGVGNMQNEGVLEMPKLRIENRGVGDVTLKLKTELLETALLGVGNIFLQGESKTHQAEIKGTGRLEAIDLVTEESHIVNSGVGTSRVQATEKLYAELNGVGRIVYRGNPRVQSKINGLGSIVSE
jgi:hypothetical protein